MNLQSGVFIMKKSSLLNQDVFKKLLISMPINEINKINKYRNQDDKENSLLAYYLLQFILNKYFFFSGDFCFKRDHCNRPYLESFEWRGDFNISHSNSYIVIAVTNNGKVGIDVEKKINLFNNLMVDYVLSKNELKVFHLLSSQEKIDYFYKLWTLKESYTKSIGYGLLMDLSHVEFSLNDREISFSNDGVKNLEWNFEFYELDEEYQISLCFNDLSFAEEMRSIDYSDFISSLI